MDRTSLVFFCVSRFKTCSRIEYLAALEILCVQVQDLLQNTLSAPEYSRTRLGSLSSSLLGLSVVV